MSDPLTTWLVQEAVGPALVEIPLGWAATAVVGSARSWFDRLRGKDDLALLVRAAASDAFELSNGEFESIRKLLSEETTWRELPERGVDDLVSGIMGQLEDGRSREQSEAIAVSIARAVLEFVVAHLDPDVFQHVLWKRIERLEAHLESKIDDALLDLHVDLAARLVATEQLDAQHFRSVIGHLQRVLERLPPRPAGRSEIVIYLTALIDWLNDDPWPQHRRHGGPRLTPAGMERKLRLALENGASVDADEAADRCERLVIRGGPGSGKTWLSKRTARRCAERALSGLAEGNSPELVELPIYTAWPQLRPHEHEDIRTAVIKSAINQLPDLGSGRVAKSIIESFAERNTATLLVLDDLNVVGSRVRLVDSLPWRIAVTTQPGSWDDQLDVTARGDSGLVGDVLPLVYPDDVEPVIEAWFSDRPDRAEALIDQTRQRQELQSAAVVPLVLAFYCIIGADEPLPRFQRELVDKVIKRLLISTWRDTPGELLDPIALVEQLSDWAWSGVNVTDSISGLGSWANEIHAPPSRISAAERAALDNVAAPTGPPSFEDGSIPRQFIHRSIRDHLVAQHVARLDVPEAVAVLLPHLWYDSDWEYVAPAAIAAHDQRHAVLTDLLCRVAGSATLPGDLSPIDPGGELRRLLVRIAAETYENDWSTEVADLIGNARVELAESDEFAALGQSAHWTHSNQRAINALATRFEREKRAEAAVAIGHAMARLRPTGKARRQACRVVLAGLQRESKASVAVELSTIVLRLRPNANERHIARETLYSKFNNQEHRIAINELGPMIARYAATPEERHEAKRTLLDKLDHEKQAKAAVEIASTMLAFDPTAAERSHVILALSGLLKRERRPGVASELGQLIAQLDPTAEQQGQARRILLVRLETTVTGAHTAWLARVIAVLSPMANERQRTYDALMLQISAEPRDEVAAELGEALAPFASTVDARRRVRRALLARLSSETPRDTAKSLVQAAIRLLAAPDHAEVRQELLSELGRQDQPMVAADLGSVIAGLAPTSDESRHALDALLRHLTPGGGTDHEAVPRLIRSMARLGWTEADRETVRERLLHYVTNEDVEANDAALSSLADATAQLNPTAAERRHARGMLLSRGRDSEQDVSAKGPVRGLAKLSRTADERGEVRDVVLAKLAQETDESTAVQLVGQLAKLRPGVQHLDAHTRWVVPPTRSLLRVLRQNSSPAEWIGALPRLVALLTSKSHDRGSGKRIGKLNLTLTPRKAFMMGDEIEVLVKWLGGDKPEKQLCRVITTAPEGLPVNAPGKVKRKSDGLQATSDLMIKPGESLRLGHDIEIYAQWIRSNKIRFRISAPEELRVLQKRYWLADRREREAETE